MRVRGQFTSMGDHTRPWCRACPNEQAFILARAAAAGVECRPSLSRSAKDKRMVVIRLARGGAKKRPFYSLVVADSRRARDGRYVERVGFYNPMAAQGERKLEIALDRVSYWQSHGAQLSLTVRRLVRQQAGEAKPTA